MIWTLHVKIQSTCTNDSQSGNQDSSSDSNDSSTMIFIIIGVVVVFALLGGILMMRGNKEQDHVGFKWADSTLPAQDAIANSMYGGTQQIFQQPMAAPQYAQPQPMYQQPQPMYQQPQPVPTATASSAKLFTEGHLYRQLDSLKVGQWTSGNTMVNNI